MWRWIVDRLSELTRAATYDFIGATPRKHEFEPVISLLEDDGRLVAFQCRQCGYCSYVGSSIDKHHPPCIPRQHQWVPVKVFQWEHLAISNKLPEPLQCASCGVHALTNAEFERFGCTGPRR